MALLACVIVKDNESVSKMSLRPMGCSGSLHRRHKYSRFWFLAEQFSRLRSCQVILLSRWGVVLDRFCGRHYGSVGSFVAVSDHSVIPALPLPVLRWFFVAFRNNVFSIVIWVIFFSVRPRVYFFPKAEARRSWFFGWISVVRNVCSFIFFVGIANLCRFSLGSGVIHRVRSISAIFVFVGFPTCDILIFVCLG